MASSTADPSSLVQHSDSCLPHHPPRVASVMLSLFYAALLICAVLGNVLALRLAYQKDEKINSTGVFLVHLAVSDLLFALTLPGKITYFLLDFSWPFGEGLCRLTAFIFFVNTYSGVYLMPCVSVDRYLAVVRVHQRPRLREPGRAQLICAAVWVLAMLQTALLLGVTMTTRVAGRLTCMEYGSVQRVFTLPVTVPATSALSLCGPVAVILFCYVKIAAKLRRTARDNPPTGRRGRRRRACLLTLAVLVAVGVCFIPCHLHVIQFMVTKMLRQPPAPSRGLSNGACSSPSAS